MAEGRTWGEAAGAPRSPGGRQRESLSRRKGGPGGDGGQAWRRGLRRLTAVNNANNGATGEEEAACKVHSFLHKPSGPHPVPHGGHQRRLSRGKAPK